MSYELSIGGQKVISRLGEQNQNLDVFNSFWLGFRFTLDQYANVTIGDSFGAIYCSHDSGKIIPTLRDEGPRIDTFGAITSSLTISTETADETQELTLDCVDYVDAVDCHCGNQAMQLHLLRFDPTRIGGIGSWVDDKGWSYSGITSDEIPQTGRPWWKREVGYKGRKRKAFASFRHRSGPGIQALALSLPLERGSLYCELLDSQGSRLPEISLEAVGGTDPENMSKQWGDKFDGSAAERTGRAWGIAMICAGAFTSIRFNDILRNDWFNRIDSNQQQQLTRALWNLVVDYNPGEHSIGGLADLETVASVSSFQSTPLEVFSIRA